MVGEADQAKITFKDKYGIEQDVNPVWTTSSPDIASVDTKGIVSGLKPGQAFLIVSHSTVKDTALITVVGDATAVAKVEVAESVTVLTVGQSVTLSATVKNINNQPISGKIVNWQSSNELVLSINSAGVATANTNGTASVVAIVDGVTSNPVNFIVGNTSRMGEFVKSGGYDASGTCNLSVENNKLVLKLENNFKTSFALGTFIYLSNTNTSASTVKSAGLELGQISVNGMHSFDITAIDSSVKIGDYKYVIILCKPATVIFGYAELK
jgi:Electron transfer DM13